MKELLNALELLKLLWSHEAAVMYIVSLVS